MLGGTTRAGHWTPPRRLRVVAIMGGAELDFSRSSAFSPESPKSSSRQSWAGFIIVPPQLAVEMNGIAIMGGFAHSEGAPAQHDPERLVLRVSGVALIWAAWRSRRALSGSAGTRPAAAPLPGKLARGLPGPPRFTRRTKNSPASCEYGAARQIHGRIGAWGGRIKLRLAGW